MIVALPSILPYSVVREREKISAMFRSESRNIFLKKTLKNVWWLRKNGLPLQSLSKKKATRNEFFERF